MKYNEEVYARVCTPFMLDNFLIRMYPDMIMLWILKHYK